MKLLLCLHCGDIVRLFPEPRSCRCGKSSGHYLADNSTTVQPGGSLSVGMHNQDFAQAVQAFKVDPEHFSPVIVM